LKKEKNVLFCAPPLAGAEPRGGSVPFKKSSDFNQKAPPIFRIRILGPAKRDCPCLAACLPCLPAGRRQRAAGGAERQSSQSGPEGVSEGDPTG